MKQSLCICLMLLMMLYCSGCRDRQENDDLTVVAGIAVDGENGNYQLTTETLVAGGEQEGGKRLLTESRGTTLNGALLETANLTAQQLYYTHAQTMVVSHDLATQGLEPLLLALERQNSFRLSLRILVAQESAGDMISLKETQESAASFQLRAMADTSWHNATSPDTPLYRFLSDVGEAGIQGILPLAGLRQNGEEQAMEILGTALFRDYTLVGTLDDQESQALLWMRESAKGGLLEGENLALTVVRCDRKLSCTPEGAAIKLTLELQEQEGAASTEQLEKQAQAIAQDRCRKVLAKLQDMGCDAIGLGQALLKQYPAEGQRVREQWALVFADYPVEIRVTAKIRDQGRIKEGTQ